MPRPCTCHKPCSPKPCRFCWLWENDPAYRAHWQAQGKPVRVPKPRRDIGQLARDRKK